jgi:iron-regulated transporter 1
VSLLTTFYGYSVATAILLGLALSSFVAEFWWIEVVYKRFPVLQESTRLDREDRPFNPVEGARRNWRGFREWGTSEIDDWAEFIRLPIFASEPHD